MKKKTGYLTGLLVCLGSASLPLYADPSGQYGIQVGTEAFVWREFVARDELLEERGARMSVGVNFDNLRRQNSGMLYGVNGKFYFGRVDYDGQTQSGIPVQSDTTYYGFQIEGLGGYRFSRRSLGMDIFGGVGLDFWDRYIDDTALSNGTPVSGAEEFYYVFFSKLGLGFFHDLQSWQYLIQAGVKYPFYTLEIALDVLGEDALVSPRGRLSAFSKAQIQFGKSTENRWSLAVYYDSYRFSESEPDVLVNGFAFQPDSHQGQLGLQVGYYFR